MAPAARCSVPPGMGDKVYLHELGIEDEVIVLPEFGREISSAKLMYGGKSIRFEKTHFETVVHLPEHAQELLDTIVVFETC